MEYIDWWSVSLSFALVIILLISTLWGLKRFGGLQTKRQQDTSFIRVLDTKTLAPRQQAIVMEIDNQRFLIGISSNGPQRLGQWQKPKKKSFEETLDVVQGDSIDSTSS